MKKISFWIALLAPVALLAGCATSGRNYQTDVDSLNARMTALQGQLSAKDQEISALQSKMNDERLAREASGSALRNAESEKQALTQQINSTSKSSASKNTGAGSEYLK
jgi:chromosome segregation ATPase